MMLVAANCLSRDSCRQFLDWNDRCPGWRQRELTLVVKLAPTPLVAGPARDWTATLRSDYAEVSEVCRRMVTDLHHSENDAAG